MARFAKLTEPSTTNVVARSLMIGRKIKIAKIIHMATRVPKSTGSLFAIELFVRGNLVVDTLVLLIILQRVKRYTVRTTGYLFAYNKNL